MRGDGSIQWEDGGRRSKGSGGTSSPRKPRRNRTGWRLFRYGRRILYVVLLGAAVWGGVAYWSFREAVQERNDLVPAKVMAALDPASGPIMTTPHNILLLGSDSRGAGDSGRSDSMILMRVDIPRRRISMLSVPRDLRVPVTGLGQEKVNAAYANGGPALTIKTLGDYTGADINHIMEINFEGFRELIDGIGGITLDNPSRIHSERFDGREWMFRKGEIQLDGQRALAFARVRKNKLDPGDSDVTRGARQQQVIDAVADKVTSQHAILHPKGYPEAVVKPLVTDVSASQLIALAFARTWAKNTVHCRLGGELDMVDGQSVLVGDEQNRAVVRMWQGQQPVIRPNLRANQFAPGCWMDGDRPPTSSAGR